MRTRETPMRGATRKATRGRVRGPGEGGRELRVRAIFGLGCIGPGVRDEAAGARRARPFRDPPALGPGVTLVHGPSGSGKTTLLRAMARACRREGSLVREVSPGMPASSRSVVGCSGRGLQGWLRTLASCGLAEASLLVRRAGTLSAGESFRLALALALEWGRVREAKRGSGRGCVLMVDEACAILDDATARGVCRTLRRVASSSPGLRIVVASASPGRLRRALGADREIELCLGGVPRGPGQPGYPESGLEKEGS